jgi:hypothetical protein
VLFLEAGELKDEKIAGRAPPLYRGNYRLFCNEVWEFTLPSGTKIARFTSSSAEDDEIFWQMGEQVIEKIDIEGTFEKTHVHFAGGYHLTILKEDELETFHFTLKPEEKILSVNGDGTFELSEYIPEPKQPHRVWLKESKSVSIERSLLQEWAGDLFPISTSKAQELIKPIFGEEIQQIEARSGSTFLLRFGSRDIRTKLGHTPFRYYLSIEEVWMVFKNGEAVLDAKKDAFHFIDTLISLLNSQTINSFQFKSSNTVAKIEFSDGVSLQVKESSKYARWHFHDFFTGLSLSSTQDNELAYRLSTPDHLEEKYQSDDLHLSHIHYELDFWREYLAKE